MKPAGYVIKGARIVNEGQILEADLRIQQERIAEIGKNLSLKAGEQEVIAEGCFLIPGAIDDQVHFREPGLTHKGCIRSESLAAAAGGVTTYFEMPNTSPPAITVELLEQKFRIAETDSAANFSFFMGASNDNLSEIRKLQSGQTCGLKIFMGSSTGNMLVDRVETLESIFKEVRIPVATHCEDEATIRRNADLLRQQYGEDLPPALHPVLRSEEACFLSSSLAIELAKRYDTRLHVLHISTAKEANELFTDPRPIEQKRITGEACIHHLWFSDADYAEKGNWINRPGCCLAGFTRKPDRCHCN